ncbi:hypothetical protein MWN34_10615 [Ancylobacter sp. 6x-1]|uniref:Uncharacterized protein n=1 Tax=Ancylobacter crimeensis TaxID=2579147 RepID=A0ABT0DBU0_9HYPH|nr:hypothetical protein [Ancylobacter crimeensis]MCK0197364.1 hypothetical protein [Ancylobacter crimeensis]
MTFERAVQLARLAAAKDIAPYLLLYQLGTMSAPALGQFCLRLGYDGPCIK